jgi:hypothetical protein
LYRIVYKLEKQFTDSYQTQRLTVDVSTIWSYVYTVVRNISAPIELFCNIFFVTK